MQEITLEGLCDLRDDFLSAVTTERVDLRTALICQVKSTKKKNETEDAALLLVTSVQTATQEKKTLTVPRQMSLELNKVGCFYQIGKKRYLPTRDVNSRCMYDYFGVSTEHTINRFTPGEDVLLLASKFRNTGSIGFVSMSYGKGFRRLVGMKSYSGSNQDSALLEIVRRIAKMHETRFYTNYMEQDQINLDFTVLCKMEDMFTKDGFPLYIQICDDATARRSMQITVAAEVEGHMIKLQTFQVNHRLVATGKQLTEKTEQMLQECETTSLNVNLPKEIIIDHLMPLVPKKTRETFVKFITNADTSAVKAACDVLKENIFNPLDKQHKTYAYDGGREKYEIALGSLLKS